MSVSSCYLNVTYYTRQHFFESEPKTRQIQRAPCLEEDGIDWHDPANGTCHNKHPRTACRLCKPNRMFNAYGPLNLFFHFATRQHGSWNHQLSYLESNHWDAVRPKKSQETVCLCSQADGNTPRGELDVMFRQRKLIVWSHIPTFLDARVLLFTSICIFICISFKDVTLKNNHSPECLSWAVKIWTLGPVFTYWKQKTMTTTLLKHSRTSVSQ